MSERIVFGARETMPLTEDGHTFHSRYSNARTVSWAHPGLKITRLRLLSDPGYPEWDVNYCYGTIGAELVKVELPFSSLPKRRMMKAIIQHAKADGVYAKGVGVFDAMSTLN